MNESRAPFDSRSVRLDEVIGEYHRRIDAGESVDLAQFVDAHGDVADELLSYFQQEGQFIELADALGVMSGQDSTVDSAGNRTDENTPAMGSSGRVGDDRFDVPGMGSVRFGDYELIEEVARGGMGVVFKARQVSLNRLVALKMILAADLAGPEHVARFYTEAESAGQLDHPGLVPVYEIGEHEGRHFFSMGFVDGGSLADRLAAGPVAAREAATLIRDVAIAVGYAHRHGVIHRDLKPANILLDDGHPRVADFGLAKLVQGSSGMTATGQVMGTPSYMPPEQAGGHVSEVGEAADIYALGAVLYALLTGRPPFQATTPMETLLQVLHDEPVSPSQLIPTLDRDLETVCLKCLSKEPQRRYTSAEDLADDLGRFLRDEPIHARAVGLVERVTRWGRRNRAVASLLTAVVVTLLLGISVSTYFGVEAMRQATMQSQQREIATEKAELAIEQANVALTGFETILYDLQNTLVDNPAALGQRRTLLKRVVAELDRLSADVGESDRVLRCQGTALLALAEVLMEAGDEAGLNAMSTTEEHYDAAVGVFREIFTNDPRSRLAIHDLAEALTERGDMLADARDWKAALASFLEGEELFRQLVNDPELASVERYRDDRIDWGANLVLCGEAYTELNQSDQAEVFLLKGHDVLSDVFSNDTSDRKSGLALGRALRKLGDWRMRIGQRDAAEARYREFATLTSELVAQYPLDIDCIMEASTGYERLGNVQRSRGERDKAKQSYQTSMNLVATLETASEQSVRLMWDVSFSYQKYAEICAAMRQWDEALAPAKKCVEIRSEVYEADPTGVWLVSKLAHSQALLAKIHEGRGEWGEAIGVHESRLALYRSLRKRKDSTAYANQIAATEGDISRCREQAVLKAGAVEQGR